MVLRKLLVHPLTRVLDVDTPATTQMRREIVLSNRFLLQLYAEWYRLIAAALPMNANLPVLEIGSGAGFMSDYVPNLITSELLPIMGIDSVLDAHHLPFAANALDAVVLTDVLHHLPDPRRFLSETARCIQAGGRLIMIEPWVTAWSTQIYTRLHSEPFVVGTPRWEFDSTGPLSGANGALPWIIFERDKAQFLQEYPEWQICKIDLLMPFSYLVSGGVSMRQLMPGWSYPLWRGVEQVISPLNKHLAMFALIVLERTTH